MRRRVIETGWLAILTTLLLLSALLIWPSCLAIRHKSEAQPEGVISYFQGNGAAGSAAPTEAPAAPPAPGVPRAISEDQIGSLPAWQQEMLNQPGSSQAYIPPRGEVPTSPPTYEQLMKETQQAMNQSPGNPQQPGQPGQNPQNVGPTAPPSSQSVQSRIDSWFSPKAYAADNLPAEQYLIRTGNITLKVDSFDTVATQVSDVAAKYKGEVTDSQMQKAADGSKSGFVTLRVPKESFFDAWNELLKLGDVDNQSQSAQDVGREFVAAISQVKNLTTEQDTLRGMLADAREVQRTRGLGEAYSILLETEKRLSEVTGELQTANDTADRLADQINRSSITVNLNERAVYQSEGFQWNTKQTLNQAWKDLLLGIRNAINGLLYFLVTMWLWLVPLAVALVIVWLVLRAVIRASQARQRRKDAARR